MTFAVGRPGSWGMLQLFGVQQSAGGKGRVRRLVRVQHYFAMERTSACTSPKARISICCLWHLLFHL